ncbi:MAG: hypothetical protein ABI882_02010 [Acidobacteriota bacterium]
MKYTALSFVLVATFLCLTPAEANEQKRQPRPWTAAFPVDRKDLSATGRNPYFVLEPGYQLIFEGGDERLVISVLSETKTLDAVETRVVEERETRAGHLVEVSRNFFAISRRSNDVFYFGEEVDTYKAGKVVSHEGAWLAGVNGARFGLMMPGEVRPGAKYYQEIAPRLAMDRAEILSLSEIVTTPAGVFRSCLRVEETTPLEPGVKEYKYYASGVGLVQDGDLKLVKYDQVKARAN